MGKNILDILSNYAEQSLKHSQEIQKKIDQVYDLDRAVLILGETGVGKEQIARQIHEKGGNEPENFHQVNCASLSEELTASELFGHIKGSFTGAISDKKGLLEQSGTVFLDEIAEVSLQIQAMLLHATQRTNPEIRPVGALESKKVKARLIFATNKDLKEDVCKGSFREDLFYRISTFVIHVPPLRERKEDIPIYTGQFLREFLEHHNDTIWEPARKIKITYFDKDVLDKFIAYDWPGNVRELRNEIDRLIVSARSTGRITANLLSESIRHPEKSMILQSEKFQEQLMGLVDKLSGNELNLKARSADLELLLYKRAILLSKTKKEAAELLGESWNTVRSRPLWKQAKTELGK